MKPARVGAAMLMLPALLLPAGCAAEDLEGANSMAPARPGLVLPAPLDGPLFAVEADDGALVWPPSLAALPASRRAGLTDLEVVAVSGDSIGEVDQVLANGRREVVAVTVETGGLLGLDDEEVIVPLNRLELGPTGESFITALSEDELEALPAWRD